MVSHGERDRIESWFTRGKDLGSVQAHNKYKLFRTPRKYPRAESVSAAAMARGGGGGSLRERFQDRGGASQMDASVAAEPRGGKREQRIGDVGGRREGGR